MPTPDETRWLSREDQHRWRAYLIGSLLLSDRLDRELREAHGLSMAEYEVLVRLSESPDRRMRMAALADSMSHSRSRVTHTVARMEGAGLVRRAQAEGDGRGVDAAMTELGWERLQEAAHTHVDGVRRHLFDLADADDLAAMGRVFNTVADALLPGTSPGTDFR